MFLLLPKDGKKIQLISDSCSQQIQTYFFFGPPDILPMFKSGATDGKVDAWMYGHEFEDFSSRLCELDAYSFNHFYGLLDNTTNEHKALGMNCQTRWKTFSFALLLAVIRWT